MPPLEDLSLGKRILLAAAIVAIVIVLLFLASKLTSEPAAGQSAADLYADIPFDLKLLELDKIALDEAYHEQIKFLFSVWLKDGGRNVKGATTGLKNARSAYNYATDQIAKREQQGKRP